MINKYYKAAGSTMHDQDHKQSLAPSSSESKFFFAFDIDNYMSCKGEPRKKSYPHRPFFIKNIFSVNWISCSVKLYVIYVKNFKLKSKMYISGNTYKYSCDMCDCYII